MGLYTEWHSSEMATKLGDRGSTAFYVKVATRMPDHLWRRALSEVVDARTRGEIMKSTGSLFTWHIKKLAAEWNIDLA
ncbi:MAG: hypothetical protein M3T49_03270 [Candidatus Eremiobacteraeota bacterium]|nr:hypothetical protein [Candidatus Eremiobacteraeota bacterium]